MLLLLVLGCGAEEGIVPTSGMWLYDAESITFAEDGCGLQAGRVFADVVIDKVDSDGFRLIDTSGDAFTCALGTEAFNCADLTDELTAEDAVLTFTSSNEGLFSSATALSRTLTITGVCEGADCGSLFGSVTFPCTTAVSMSAAYDRPAEALDTAFGG
jgi:hypothetical protein